MLKARTPEPGKYSDEDVEIPQSPMLESAQHFVLPLRASCGMIFLAFLLNGGYAFWTAGPVQCALLLLQFLVAAMLLMAGNVASHRAGAARDVTQRNRELEAWRAQAAAAQASPTTVVSRYYSVGYNIVIFRESIVSSPYLLALSGFAIAGLSIWTFVRPLPPASYAPLDVLQYIAILVNFLVALGCVVLGTWLKNQPDGIFPEARALSAWCRGLQWTSLLMALVALSRVLGGDNLIVVLRFADGVLGHILLAVVLGIALELGVVAALAAVAKRSEFDVFRLPFSATLADNVFVSPSVLAETIATLEARLGLNVRSSYVVAQLRRDLPFVVLGVIALLWLSTCLFTIGTAETGVLTRFGRRINDSALGPGLHCKLPFPIDAIQTVSSERFKVAVVGAPLDTSRPILWANPHTLGGPSSDFNQVLGQGREVVSVHALVFYRVKDAQAYLFNTQNPDDAVSSLAYKVIMREIVRRDVDQLLSLDRVGFSSRLRDELQSVVDAQRLGIEVASFPLVGLHPPVDVAQDYQSVVSAQIAAVTSATQANAARISEVSGAQADRDVAIKQARGAAATRLAGATGEAASFDAVHAAYAASPQDYEERLWLETLEDALAGKKLYLVDRKNAAATDFWVDLRGGGPVP